jgi:hypothetical protein
MASNEDHKEYREGPEAAKRFERTMSTALKVSKEELAKREAAYQKARTRKSRINR